jgi:dGTP triphosphohydrolase
VLFVADDTNFIVNTCDKRTNQNDKSLRTIEKLISTSPISNLYKNEVTTMFFEALDFTKLDKSNMESLYQGYMQAVIQFQTAVVTGTYIKRTTVRTQEDLLLLSKIENIEKDIVQLTNQLKKETQLNSKVALNIAIQNKRKEIQEIKNTLATL